MVHFGKHITELTQDDDDTVWVDGQPYHLVVMSDGGFSALRKYVVSKDENASHQEEPAYAGYVVWRGSVGRSDLPRHFSIEEGVYKAGMYDTIVLKMCKDNGEDVWTMGTFIATPEEDIQQYWQKDIHGKSRHDHNDDDTKQPPHNSRVPDWFLPHFQTHFANVPGLVPLIQAMMVRGEITPHPQFEYGATTVRAGRLLLTGDAAHMASPRTAVGAHTAILDALALRAALAAHPDDLDAALARYSVGGVERAQELYDRTREVSQQFLPP